MSAIIACLLRGCDPRHGNAAPEDARRNEAYEDKLYWVCNGTDVIPCTKASCENGFIVKYFDQPFEIPMGGGRVQRGAKKVKAKSKCPTCGGEKSIQCPFSNNGLDHRSRK